MTHKLVTTLLLAAGIGFAATTIARADCESDMLQLEEAFKTPAMTDTAKAALEEAKTKSVAAMKKDDDTNCHAAILDGLTKAGMKMK